MARPVHEVFEFVRDENNIAKWDADLVKVTKTSQGPVGLGTTLQLEITRFMGQTGGAGEVIGYEPDRVIEFQFSMGKFNPHVWHVFEPAGEGTRFTRRVQLDPPGGMKLLSPMISKQITRKNVEYLAKLKSLIEPGNS